MTELQSRRAVSGWTRIGLKASVLWLIVGGAWGWLSVVPEAMKGWISDDDYRCVYVLHESPAVCSQKWSENTKWIWKEGGIAAAIYAFPPVLIGWPLMWGFVALVRWIRAGFRQE